MYIGDVVFTLWNTQVNYPRRNGSEEDKWNTNSSPLVSIHGIGQYIYNFSLRHIVKEVQKSLGVWRRERLEKRRLQENFIVSRHSVCQEYLERQPWRWAVWNETQREVLKGRWRTGEAAGVCLSQQEIIKGFWSGASHDQVCVSRRCLRTR